MRNPFFDTQVRWKGQAFAIRALTVSWLAVSEVRRTVIEHYDSLLLVFILP